MRRIKIIGLALCAVVALSAVISATASAKPVPPLEEYPTMRFIEKGDPMQFVSDEVVLATSVGNIQCSVGELDATLESNGLKTDEFSITGAMFNGAGGAPCSGPTSLGDATVVAMPPTGGWLGTFKTNGTSEVIGNPNLIGNPDLLVSVTFGELVPAVHCTWEASKVKSSFDADGRPIQITEADEKFKVDRSMSDAACPRTGTMSASWTLTTSVPGSTSDEQAPVVLG